MRVPIRATAFLLTALLPVAIPARAQVVLYPAGDLPGGATVSLVRDATRVGTEIVAVGGGSAVAQTVCSGPNVPAGCVPNLAPDTTALWRFDTTTGARSITALPNLVVNPTAVNAILSAAITRDGRYVASMARSAAVGTARVAVRVETALVPFPSANLNLSVAPYNATAPSAATAVSADGSVLYGNAGGVTRARRFDLVNAGGIVTVPLLRASDISNIITARGASADGRVAVGTSFPAGYTGNALGQAFRFEWTGATGVLTPMPFGPGGTWSRPVALTQDGRRTLLVGDTTARPNGSLFVHDAATGTLDELGSPNTAWHPINAGGMTDDGSVVTVSLGFPNSPWATGYIHNAHGWFTLGSVLRHAGLDLRADGWDVSGSTVIQGLSPDGRLLYGAIGHNGAQEGFVIDFPAGYLAGFDVAPVVPLSTALVGAWAPAGYTPGARSQVVVFMRDGRYAMTAVDVPAGESGSNGMELGTYQWDPVSGRLVLDTRLDGNGDEGASGANDRSDITLTLAGDTLTVTVPGDDTVVLTRLPFDVDSFVGTWFMSDDANHLALTILPDGTYIEGELHLDGSNGLDGMERGTFAIDPSTGVITVTVTLDTNGEGGLSSPIGPNRAVLGPDGLTALGGDDTGLRPLDRIVDPDAVRPVLTSAASVSGIQGQALPYAVTATFRPLSFGATGLPPGLTIDGASGLITGVPSAGGTFTATVTAANTLATGQGAVQFVIQADSDLDGIVETADNCPLAANPGQQDADGDGIGDACDPTPNGAVTPGRMRGEGFVRDDDTRYAFEFFAREDASGQDRAALTLRVNAEGRRRRGKPRDDRFVTRSVTAIVFSDDPTITPGRPRRPQVDTVVFSGTGEWNGAPGYTYEVRAQDAGEPGRHRESIRMVIRSPQGAVVVSFDDALDGGNIQSLRLRH